MKNMRWPSLWPLPHPAPYVPWQARAVLRHTGVYTVFYLIFDLELGVDKDCIHGMWSVEVQQVHQRGSWDENRLNLTRWFQFSSRGLSSVLHDSHSCMSRHPNLLPSSLVSLWLLFKMGSSDRKWRAFISIIDSSATLLCRLFSLLLIQGLAVIIY